MKEISTSSFILLKQQTCLQNLLVTLNKRFINTLIFKCLYLFSIYFYFLFQTSCLLFFFLFISVHLFESVLAIGFFLIHYLFILVIYFYYFYTSWIIFYFLLFYTLSFVFYTSNLFKEQYVICDNLNSTERFKMSKNLFRGTSN